MDTELHRKFLTAAVLLEEQAREEYQVEIIDKVTPDAYRAVRDTLKAEGIVSDNVSRIAAAITLKVKRSIESVK